MWWWQCLPEMQTGMLETGSSECHIWHLRLENWNQISTQLINLRELSLRTGMTSHTKLYTFPMMSSLPVSQSSSNPRRWVTGLMSVLWPVWGWLQHRVWSDYEEVLRTVGCPLGTCKSAVAGHSHMAAQWFLIGMWSSYISDQRWSLCLFVGIVFLYIVRQWIALVYEVQLSFDDCYI